MEPPRPSSHGTFLAGVHAIFARRAETSIARSTGTPETALAIDSGIVFTVGVLFGS